MQIKSALAAVGVTAAFLVPAAPAEAEWDCSIPVARIGSFQEVSVYTGVGDGAGVCVYVGLYYSEFYQGRYRIGITGVSAVPTIDADVASCPTTDDVVAGAVADPSNRLVYTPYRLAAGVYGDWVQVCVVTRDVRVRLLFAAQNGDPEVVVDDHGPSSGGYPGVEPGSASRACMDRGHGPVVAMVGGVGVHAGWGLGNDGAVYFCLRAAGVGGRLRVDPDGDAGSVVMYDDSAAAACTTSWWSTTAPVVTSVRSGPPNLNGATPVCISVAGSQSNWFVYGTYRPGTPAADWVFDS